MCCSQADWLAWLTGFTGSAGHAAILEDKAVLIVDSRYTPASRGGLSRPPWPASV